MERGVELGTRVGVLAALGRGALWVCPRGGRASALAEGVVAGVGVVLVVGVGENRPVSLGAGGGPGGKTGGRRVGALKAELSLSALLLVQVLLGHRQLEEAVAGLAGVQAQVDKVAAEERHERKADGPAEPRR